MTRRSPLAEAVILISLSLTTYAVEAATDVFEATVVHVTDGDTLTVAHQGHRLKLELAGMDAPEIGQPHGMRAKRALAALTFNRKVKVRLLDVADGNEGHLSVAGLDVAQEMVRAGQAWVVQGALSARHLALTERTARGLRRGLWASDASIAPWRWRAGVR